MTSTNWCITWTPPGVEGKRHGRCECGAAWSHCTGAEAARIARIHANVCPGAAPGAETPRPDPVACPKCGLWASPSVGGTGWRTCGNCRMTFTVAARADVETFRQAWQSAQEDLAAARAERDELQARVVLLHDAHSEEIRQRFAAEARERALRDALRALADGVLASGRLRMPPSPLVKMAQEAAALAAGRSA